MDNGELILIKSAKCNVLYLNPKKPKCLIVYLYKENQYNKSSQNEK